MIFAIIGRGRRSGREPCSRVEVHVWVRAKVPVVLVELLSIVRRRERTVARLATDDERPVADWSKCGRRWDEWGSRICWEPVHDERRIGVARV